MESSSRIFASSILSLMISLLVICDPICQTPQNTLPTTSPARSPCYLSTAVSPRQLEYYDITCVRASAADLKETFQLFAAQNCSHPIRLYILNVDFPLQSDIFAPIADQLQFLILKEWLFDNSTTDSPFAGMSNLDTLDIQFSALTDFSVISADFLKPLTNLRILQLEQLSAKMTIADDLLSRVPRLECFGIIASTTICSPTEHKLIAPGSWMCQLLHAQLSRDKAGQTSRDYLTSAIHTCKYDLQCQSDEEGDLIRMDDTRLTRLCKAASKKSDSATTTVDSVIGSNRMDKLGKEANNTPTIVMATSTARILELAMSNTTRKTTKNFGRKLNFCPVVVIFGYFVGYAI